MIDQIDENHENVKACGYCQTFIPADPQTDADIRPMNCYACRAPGCTNCFSLCTCGKECCPEHSIRDEDSDTGRLCHECAEAEGLLTADDD
jgi:hypothetical protein